MKDVDVFRAALSAGKAIPAWQLAYLLARLSPPSPTHDAPITIPIDERPPLVIAALRWISERAAEEPCSAEDEGRRQRGWVEHFVRPEVALTMLEEARQKDDPWMAMPYVRVLDAAQLLAGDEPRPGVFVVEDLSPHQRVAAELIVAECGCRVPSKWLPILDESDWIAHDQFVDFQQKIASNQGGDVKEPVQSLPKYGKRTAKRAPVVIEAMKSLGLDPMRLSASPSGMKGARAMVKKKALQINAEVFGPGDKKKAFDNTWVAMQRGKDVKIVRTDPPKKK